MEQYEKDDQDAQSILDSEDWVEAQKDLEAAQIRAEAGLDWE